MSGGVRGALEQLRSKGQDVFAGGVPAQSRVAFTIAIVSLAAKMSKADGVSLPIEIEAFERQFSIPTGERDNVRRLFKLAAQDVAGFEVYAGQIAHMLGHDKDLRVAVLECLFHVASADGVLHPSEDTYLAKAAEIFGLSKTEYRCVRRGFVVEADSPYEILNVSPAASDAEIKARYRELVKGHHPDALMSKGVPAEFLAGAERRLARITAAYEQIQTERGNRASQSLEKSS